MRSKPQEELKYDPEIEKTAKALRKKTRLKREAARAATITQGLSDGEVDFSEPETESMAANPPERTLGDYMGKTTEGMLILGSNRSTQYPSTSRTRCSTP
jgi:hypothetical protein